jgi:hypothetical protein
MAAIPAAVRAAYPFDMSSSKYRGTNLQPPSASLEQ